MVDVMHVGDMVRSDVYPNCNGEVRKVVNLDGLVFSFWLVGHNDKIPGWKWIPGAKDMRVISR